MTVWLRVGWVAWTLSVSMTTMQPGPAGVGKGEGEKAFSWRRLISYGVMAGTASAASVFSWLGALSFWFRSDQPIMAMTIPPETCMMPREMPKKPRRDEPMSSTIARKTTVLMAILRARAR